MMIMKWLFGVVALSSAVSGGAKPTRPATDAVLYSNIRSTTWYEWGVDYSQSLIHLQAAIPAIKANGFNTVWLVTPWNDLNPKPLAVPPVYNRGNFAQLRKTLGALKRSNMRAIMGLNYLGRGWAPEGIDPCAWIVDRTMYSTFETYVNRVMSELKGLEDSVYLLVFTENAEPCGLDPHADADQIMALLRSSLGSLPTRLNQTARSTFRIGYHDYSYINVGWGGGLSPVAEPNPFDFLSMVAYGLEKLSDKQILEELAMRAGRFRSLYPTVPLIVGEYGSDYCVPRDEANQERVVHGIASYSLSEQLGANVWGWKPLNETSECAGQPGLSITRVDGTLRPAAVALRGLFQSVPLN